MLPACFFVDNSAVTTDLDGLTTVARLRSDELDPAVAMPVVLPVHKCGHQLTGGLLAREWPPRVVGPVLRRAEQRFRVGAKSFLELGHHLRLPPGHVHRSLLRHQGSPGPCGDLPLRSVPPPRPSRPEFSLTRSARAFSLRRNSCCSSLISC